MDGLAESLQRSPELFPHSFDELRERISFIRLSRSDYQAASFLDGRILLAGVLQTSLPWAEVEAAIAAAQLPERCGYIFHIGHVGSTLLSRLMGSHPGVLSVREPLLLRLFASQRARGHAGWSDKHYGDRLAGGLKLLSRTFHREQIAIVKATSFVSELAVDLLARPSAPAAVAVLAEPHTYLATMLGGANSRREAKQLLPSRLRRLHRRIGREVWQQSSLSEGEALALSWACETAALAAVPAGRLLRVDFDRFLAEPGPFLVGMLRHFHVAVTPDEVGAILAGPDMKRYSKAPEFAYDALLRREVLTQARRDHASEIRRGLAWLERAAGEFPPVRRAVEFAAEGAR